MCHMLCTLSQEIPIKVTKFAGSRNCTVCFCNLQISYSNRQRFGSQCSRKAPFPQA